MKKITLILLAAAISFSAVAQKKSAKVQPAQPIDSASYALGINVASSLKSMPITIDITSFSKAITDFMNESATMTFDESNQFLQAYFTNLQAQEVEKNRKAGEEFMAKNGKEPNVVTLPNGLQYKMLVEGTGVTPAETDEVEVHYRGTLIDGKEFDSSYSRNETITFPLNRVIKGWTEGLQHVKEGGKVMLYIPADLAYGDRQMPSSIIEPGSTLIFEIELIKVVKPELYNEEIQ